jgi:hypothetical protein
MNPSSETASPVRTFPMLAFMVCPSVAACNSSVRGLDHGVVGVRLPGLGHECRAVPGRASPARGPTARAPSVRRGVARQPGEADLPRPRRKGATPRRGAPRFRVARRHTPSPRTPPRSA